MRTGWRPNPQSLRDRIDEDNNILIETRTSNYFKHNYPDTHYPLLKDLILSVRMPKEFVDRDITVRPYNPSLEIDPSFAIYDDEEEDDDELFREIESDIEEDLE